MELGQKHLFLYVPKNFQRIYIMPMQNNKDHPMTFNAYWRCEFLDCEPLWDH